MNKTYHLTQQIRTKTNMTASIPKPDFRKKTLVQLMTIIGIIAFTTSEAYANCLNSPSNQNCLTQDTTPSSST
ncbi:MAG: hypothetical protein J6568_08325, partial [Snodgrassella sp.]|nr:hypothetical protein [Snodgrassella sp.]